MCLSHGPSTAAKARRHKFQNIESQFLNKIQRSFQRKFTVIISEELEVQLIAQKVLWTVFFIFFVVENFGFRYLGTVLCSTSQIFQRNKILIISYTRRIADVNQKIHRVFRNSNQHRRSRRFLPWPGFFGVFLLFWLQIHFRRHHLFLGQLVIFNQIYVRSWVWQRKAKFGDDR